jgi:type IX secretion system PorP/SprF family membrane protein
MCRSQWVQFEGAPVSQFLSVDGPVISDKMGLGLLLQREEVGVNLQTDIFANYAYIIDMEKFKISMGLRCGYNIFEANHLDHKVWDTNDQYLQENTRTFQPNFGFGTFIKSEKYYAGISIPHLLNYAPETTFALDYENSNQLTRHYYLTGGYRFQIQKDFVIEPITLIKYATEAPVQLDFNLLVEYKQMATLGVGHRTGDSFVVLTKLQVTGKFQLGYSYDFTISEIKDYSDGSHEIMLSYIFGKNLANVKTPRFF